MAILRARLVTPVSHRAFARLLARLNARLHARLPRPIRTPLDAWGRALFPIATLLAIALVEAAGRRWC